MTGKRAWAVIMLILIGTVPTALRVEHAVRSRNAGVHRRQRAGWPHSRPARSIRQAFLGEDARTEVTDYIPTKQLQPTRSWRFGIVRGSESRSCLTSFSKSVPAQDQANVRNDMYVAGEAIRLMQKHDVQPGERKAAGFSDKA